MRRGVHNFFYLLTKTKNLKANILQIYSYIIKNTFKNKIFCFFIIKLFINIKKKKKIKILKSQNKTLETKIAIGIMFISMSSIDSHRKFKNSTLSFFFIWPQKKLKNEVFSYKYFLFPWQKPQIWRKRYINPYINHIHSKKLFSWSLKDFFQKLKNQNFFFFFSKFPGGCS